MRSVYGNPTTDEFYQIRKVSIEMGKRPVFDDGSESGSGSGSGSDDGDDATFPHFRIFDLLTTSFSRGFWYERRYIQCLVHVIGSSFLGCQVLYVTNGSLGGGLFLRESRLLVQGSDFRNCCAGFGGAFGAIGSSTVVRDTLFRGCSALLEGGAVVRFWDSPSEAEGAGDTGERVGQFITSEFLSCTAREAAGAIFVQGVNDTAIDRCHFTSCRAAKSGGAVAVLHSNQLVFASHFVNDSCRGRNWAELGPLGASESKPRADARKLGGGAIEFVVTHAPDPKDNEMLGFPLGTESSCFV